MTVNILGQEFEIVPEESISRDGSINGLIEYDELRIYINKNLPEERKKEVLLHEFLHEISAGLSMGLDEETVQILARSLYSLIKSNSAIFSWLVAETEQSLPQSWKPYPFDHHEEP